MSMISPSHVPLRVMYNYIMQRTQVSLSDENRRVLDIESARTGRSMSALIRAAIQQVYGADETLDRDLAALDAAFGSWNDRDFTGVEYEDALRRGNNVDRIFGSIPDGQDG